MRTTTSTINNAINKEAMSYLLKATVWKQRVFFTAIESNFPYTGADAEGINNTPAREMTLWNSNNSAVATFLANGSNVLQYCNQGSATLVTTGYSCHIRPGGYGDNIWIWNGTDVRRYAISWADITAEDTDPLTLEATITWTPGDTPLCIHGVSDTECIVIANSDGGLRIHYISGTTIYSQPLRFMFPKQRDYTDGGTERTMESQALFSGAAKLSGSVYTYISNHITGMVQGITYNITRGTWSDIYNSVLTDASVSLCEFRVSNAIASGGQIILCGQFTRTDILGTAEVYTLALISTDGIIFSMDRFTAITHLGYRFQMVIGGGKTTFSSCNRVSAFNTTKLYSGTDSSLQSTELTEADIISFDDSSLQSATLELANMFYWLQEDPFVVQGSVVEVFVGYKTTAGNEYVLYGTYIIDSVSESYANGEWSLGLNLTAKGLWKTGSYTNPFYAEIIGKSAFYETLDEDSGQLHVATTTTKYDNQISIDFWDHELYSDPDASPPITSQSFMGGGGVDMQQLGGTHRVGLKAQEYKDKLLLDDNPELTATSITAKLYGWSHPTDGSVNDIIELVVITEDENGAETEHISNEDLRWPNYYPVSAAGDYPVEITMTGLTIGHKIKHVGMIFEGTSTQACPSRIDITSGIKTQITFQDNNSPWTVPEGAETGFKIPGNGRPYIMFAQKPFNAFNFRFAAYFTNSIVPVPGLENYPLAVGILGLAEDGTNFVVGRWNKANDEAEIVLVRGGNETVLNGVDVSGLDLPDEIYLLLEHRDGLFTLSYLDGTLWTALVSYSWQNADGWMYTSETATMKCGIYGFASGPSFLITGLTIENDEGVNSSEAICHLPLQQGTIADFPTTGKVKIGNNSYNYDGKKQVSDVRGPYQFRQNALYTPPYGNGHGLECRDFWWGAAPTVLNGQMLALDDGSSFEISSVLWEVFNRTGGSRYNLPNRARYYSNNSQISELYFGLSYKVYATGGLKSFSKIEGDDYSHAWGDLCTYLYEGDIWCWNVFGASGERDNCIRDLLDIVTRLCNVEAAFPGDAITASSASWNTSVGYTDGIDIRWNAPTPTDSHNLRFTGKLGYDLPAIANDTHVKINIDSVSGKMRFSLVSYPSETVIEEVDHDYPAGVTHSFRIYAYQKFVSIYLNDQWVHTFATPDITYSATTDVYLQNGGGGADFFTNINFVELSDWREAVYIDLTTDAQSALSSIIQERPVEIIPKSNGTLAFFYDLDTRATIALSRAPYTHQITRRDPTEGASDAIVHNATEAKTVQYLPFLENHGFATRVMQLSNMYSGSFRAARILLEKAYEGRIVHSVDIRADARIEPGDLIEVSYTQQGINDARTASIIVDSISSRWQVADATVEVTMNISGRQDV